MLFTKAGNTVSLFFVIQQKSNHNIGRFDEDLDGDVITSSWQLTTKSLMLLVLFFLDGETNAKVGF